MFVGIAFVTFSFVLIIGESSLLIYKSVNGRNYPIAAVIKITNGRNVTLKCKDINNANNEVEWSRKSDTLGFQERYIRNDDCSRINFVPFRPEDADVYICKSLKYNASKSVTIVSDDNSPTKRRLKRTQYRLEGEGYDLNRIKPVRFFNVSDVVDEFFKNNMKFKYSSPPEWMDSIINDRSEVWPGYGRPGSDLFTSNVAADSLPPLELDYQELLKRNDHKTVDQSGSVAGSNEYGFLYCIAIVGGLFLFGGVMCLCVRNNPNVRARLDRTSSNGLVCTHAMCVRHRDTNPLAGCILPNLNPTNHIPTPVVHTDASGEVTVLTFADETVDEYIEEDRADACESMDTPPSYAISVDAAKSDLPPSYEEAVKIMLPGVYEDSSTPC